MSLDRSKYYGHWVPLSCFDVRLLERISVPPSMNTNKAHAPRLIHFYNNIHPITHIRLTGSVMTVNVRTINNSTNGKMSVALEVDDGSGDLVTCTFLWGGDMDSVRAKYEKLLHKTVSIRGTPYTRNWNEGQIVMLELKAVDLLDFAGEMEAIDNRMYTLEQLNLPPKFDYTRMLPEKEQSEIKFLDYEVMSMQNVVSFTDVEREEAENDAGTEEEGEKKDKGDTTSSTDTTEYPLLARLFKIAESGKTRKSVNVPVDVVVLDEDDAGESEVKEAERSAGHAKNDVRTDTTGEVKDSLSTSKSASKSDHTKSSKKASESLKSHSPTSCAEIIVLESDDEGPSAHAPTNLLASGQSTQPDHISSTTSSPISVEFSSQGSSQEKDSIPTDIHQSVKKAVSKSPYTNGSTLKNFANVQKPHFHPPALKRRKYKA